MIEDDELREIYKVSSAEHLQNLESGLLELEKNPNNPELIHTLLREAHSLKGDSRVTGVKGVETLAHKIEEILGEVKNQQRKLTSEIGDRLYQVLDGMKKLVQEAVTGEPSHINHTELLNNLTSVLDKPSGKTNGNGNGDSKKVTNRFIEDEDLREIYHISSIQHLEKIKSGLILLEKNPEDSISLSELLEEAQSFELDSRIVGREDLESLIHRLEEILVGIKEHLIPFRQVSQKLNNSLEGIKELVNEAVTGETSNIDPLQLLEQLDNLTTEETTENNTPEVQNRAGSNSLDTIRVPMRHLDSLLVHTGELTVTRTRMAHINEQIQELATVWEDWNNNKNRRQQYQEVLQRVISNLKTAAPENYTRLDLISRELDEKIRTLRLLPLSTVFLLFPRVVRDLAKEQGKEVELIIEGGDLTVDKQIIEEIKDPLMHLIRNAIDHGLEAPEERRQKGKPTKGTIVLKAYQTSSNIIIQVKDDGRGLDENLIKQTAIKRKIRRLEELALMTSEQIQSLIFAPGFSTRTLITEISGRGVGLDVVRNNVERLKGNIELISEPNQGCDFRLQLRSTLTSLSVMLVDIRGLTQAIPIEFVETTLLVKKEEIYNLEGRSTITVQGQPIAVVKMEEMLELPIEISSNNQAKRSLQAPKALGCVVITVGNQRLGLLVDELLRVLDVVIKPQSQLLKRVRNVAGATILGTGEVCMILNPPDLIKSFQKAYIQGIEAGAVTSESEVEETVKPVILLTEDSIAVRTQEKRILEKAGYEVVVAVDGLDGYNKLRNRDFDAVISDVQMPNLDGLELTAKIRQHPEYKELPIILVTSLASEEDKRKGAQAGANAYIVKDQFNQEILLETLDRLI